MPLCNLDALAESNQQLEDFGIEFHLEALTSRAVHQKTMVITHSLLKAPMMNILDLSDSRDDCWIPRRLWNALVRREIDFNFQK